MLDASAILRESLDLKQKLIQLQKQLLSGLIQVERVVDLVTPGVDPVVQAEIFHDSIMEDEEEEPLDIFPTPSSRRGSDLNYGELQKLSESSKGHPHFSTSSLVHKVQNNLRRQSRTWVDSQLLMLEPEPVPVVPPLPAAYGLLTKEDPDSPKNSPPSIEDSGIRWDNEDYIKSSEFLSTSPSPLKKSASMINKKLTRQTTNGSIATLAGGLFRRGTNWMSSNGSNVLSERTGGDIAGGHTTGSISRALGSATAGLGRMPILAPSLRSKESIRRQRVAPPPSPNHQAKSLFPATSSGVIGPNSLEASVQRSSSVTTSPSLQRRPKGEGVSKVSNHPPRFQSVISENQEASYSESLGGGNALRPDDIINTSAQEMKYLDNTSENDDGIVTPGKLSTTQEPNPSIRAPSVVLSFATQTPPAKAEDSFAVTVEYPTVERRKNHIQKSGVMQAPNAVLVSTNFSPKRIPNEAFPGKSKSKPESAAAPVHTGTSEAGGGSPTPERNSTFLAPAPDGGGGGHLGTLGNSPQKTSLSRHSLIKIAEPIPDAEFDFATTLTHRIFTCAAFDEKGYYIPVEHRQGDMSGEISFQKSGLHPRSMFSALMGLVFIISFFFAIWMEPYLTSYEGIGDALWVSWTITALFLMETLFNLITPKQLPRHLDVNRTGVRYFLGQWIQKYTFEVGLFDILSMIPWVQIFQSSQYAYPLSFIRLLRFHRLAGMMSSNPFLRQIVHNIEGIGGVGAILSRIIPMGMFFIIFLHLQACSLYYVGQLMGFYSWNVQFDHWKYFGGNGIEGASVAERYIWMLTQAVGNTFQFTFKPETIPEQAVTIGFIIFGAVLYALLVGLLSSAAVAYDSSGRLYRQKIDELTEYLNWKRIDVETQRKVLSYYEYKYRGKYFEEANLLADMNNSLRTELASINCRRLIEKVPFLKRELNDGRDRIYLGKISTALQAVYYVGGDYVFHQGEIGGNMYFIHSGTVNILTNGRVVTQLNDGAFFGEVALIASIPRTASVQAQTCCTLYSLTSKQFSEIIEEFEDMKTRIDQIYKDRMERVKKEREEKARKEREERLKMKIANGFGNNK